MKRFNATVLGMLFVLTIQPVWADSDREALFEERLAEAKVRLGLSDEQLEQAKPIMKASIEAQQSILARYGIDLEAEGGPKTRIGLRKARQLRNDLAEVRAGTLEQLDDILSDKQVKEFRKIQEERRQSVMNRMRGGS
ncbi:MAG: hypothetical protein R6V46_06225 [Desulfatiglandaceae bacterium]